MKSKNRRLCFMAILLLAFMMISACSNSETTADEEGTTDDQEPVTVTVAQSIDILSLNPYAHSATPNYSLWRHVMEPLVYFNFNTKEYYGVLAEEWTSENDGTDWTFNLRKGITFHDGSEFTAEDVVHSYNRVMEDPESLQGSYLANVSKVEAIDPYTVKIILKEPSASFLKELTLVYITSKSVYEEYGSEEADEHPIGTGAYKFKEWVRGERFVVEKNDDYWNGTPGADEIIIRPMSEDAARVTALERGEVDIIPVPLQDIERLKKNPDISIKETQSLRHLMFVLNPAIEPLDDVRVRKAINYAVDREAIAEYVLDGSVNLLNGPVGENIFGHDPSWEPYPYDPDKARELLAEAGYENGFDLEIYSPSGRYPRDVNVSETVVSQLSEVGIRAQLKTPEWGIFSEEYKEGVYPMYYIGRGSFFDADSLIRQYFRTGVTSRTLYSNPEFDEMLDKAETMLDPVEREKTLQEAERILYDDAPAVFMYSNIDYYAVSKQLDEQLDGWTPRPDEFILVGVPGEER